MEAQEGSLLDAVELLRCGLDSTLAASPLSDVLMWLYHARRDAVVVIGDEPYAATIELAGGLMVRARCGPFAGLDAVAALLQLVSGRVRVVMGQVASEPRELGGSTPDVLLACASARPATRTAA